MVYFTGFGWRVVHWLKNSLGTILPIISTKLRSSNQTELHLLYRNTIWLIEWLIGFKSKIHTIQQEQ